MAFCTCFIIRFVMLACQGFNGVFGALALVWAVGTDAFAASPTPAPASRAVSVAVSAWSPRPFADVVLDAPELAGCFALMPGLWPAALPPASLQTPADLGGVVTAQLSGVLDASDVERLTVVAVESENAALSAVASGTTILLVLPRGQAVDLQEAARTVIAALALAHSSSSAPDPRCSEPLLAFGEAIAFAGSLTLATLPPTLRPVSDWLEADDAAAPLTALARNALDGDEPWASRRVRLQQTALRSGANAKLLNAAARVVEAFGDVVKARREPYELLLAWRENRDKRYPPAPSVLRRALADPLAAGMPAKARDDDAKAIAREALERAIESGSVAALAGAADAGVSLRMLAAAQARAQGAGTACQWALAGPLAPTLRSGCRSDEKASGFVTARPRPQGGFEVYAATTPDESLLLRWPGWLLFPLVTSDGNLLVFVDADGIQAVPLDSSSAPRLLAAGEFRHLAMSPDGKHLAAAHWPGGALAMVSLAGEARSLDVDARNGVAWLDSDLLLAVGQAGATVVSVAGEKRPFPVTPGCARTAVRQGTSLLFGIAAPCDGGILQVPLGSREGTLALKRSDGPIGMVPLGDGSVVFGDSDGISRWRQGDQPTRVGGGLTPGPG